MATPIGWSLRPGSPYFVGTSAPDGELRITLVQAGDVTLVAGNQIYGNFTVANVTGTILAGAQLVGGVPQVLNANANVGASTRAVSLSLISGSWNVFAGNNVFISEVRNPNGTFNGNNLTVPAGSFSPTLIPQAGVDALVTPPTRSRFLFDYAANAAANFWAGNGIIYHQRLPAQRAKSRLNRIMATPFYKSMTIRNWATARRLASRQGTSTAPGRASASVAGRSGAGCSG